MRAETHGRRDTAVKLSAFISNVATMNKDALIRLVNEQLWTKTDVPSFKAGDTITVTSTIVEGN